MNTRTDPRSSTTGGRSSSCSGTLFEHRQHRAAGTPAGSRRQLPVRLADSRGPDRAPGLTRRTGTAPTGRAQPAAARKHRRCSRQPRAQAAQLDARAAARQAGSRTPAAATSRWRRNVITIQCASRSSKVRGGGCCAGSPRSRTSPGAGAQAARAARQVAELADAHTRSPPSRIRSIWRSPTLISMRTSG